MIIPVESYIKYGLAVSDAEKATIFDLMGQIPNEIIDCHTHCNKHDHFLGFEKEQIEEVNTTFPYFDIEQSRALSSIVYPGKFVRRLRFGFPQNGYDHREVNKYLLLESPRTDRVALTCIPTNLDYTIDELKSGNYYGLKAYPSFFVPKAEKIFSYFRPEILKACEELGIPIVLHLPKRITNCFHELEEIYTSFPKLIIVLAHMALGKYPDKLLHDAYSDLAKVDNVYMDTSMCTSADVFNIAMQTVGTSRLMYASDEPYNLLRYTDYVHPELGYRLATSFPYHWVAPESNNDYSHLAKDALLAHTQSLASLCQALNNRKRTDIIQDIFFANAKRIYQFA
jgi:hypothetical protein